MTFNGFKHFKRNFYEKLIFGFKIDFFEKINKNKNLTKIKKFNGNLIFEKS